MSNPITWSQIESECGDYRAGFVATFRKYEGRDTDERDGSNRIVKVTVKSFARHAGVPPSTFEGWIKATDQEVGTGVVPTFDRSRLAREHARRMPAEEKAKLAAELLADEDVAEQVVSDKTARSNLNRAVDDHYQRQATERADRTERKAAGDTTDQRVDALLWVNRLGEACERFSRDANESLRQVGPLPESERYWLTGAIDRAETTVRAARRYLELGDAEINVELAAILDGGA